MSNSFAPVAEEEVVGGKSFADDSGKDVADPPEQHVRATPTGRLQRQEESLRAPSDTIDLVDALKATMQKKIKNKSTTIMMSMRKCCDDEACVGDNKEDNAKVKDLIEEYERTIEAVNASAKSRPSQSDDKGWVSVVSKKTRNH